jgi:hypothetical protein
MLRNNVFVSMTEKIVSFYIFHKKYGCHVCFLSREDAELIRKYRWHIDYGTHGSLRVRANIKGKKVSLHRMVLKTKLEVDHINGNQLDNRRENLRKATRHQNACNRKVFCNNQTGCAGITKKGNRYIARIAVKNKSVYLGSFASLSDAVEVRTKAVIKYHKKFARV